MSSRFVRRSVGVVAAVLLLVVAPLGAANARPIVQYTPTGDVAPPAAATGTPATVRPSTGNPADRWVGLPKVVSGSAAATTSYSSDLFTGLVKDPGNDLNLPGLHPAGTHVRRGHNPAVGAISVTKVGGRYVVEAPVTATSSIVGERVKGAREEIFVSLTVRDGTDANASQQKVLKHLVSWARLTPGAKNAMPAAFTLDQRTSAALDAMPAAVRGKAITVDVVQAIDAAGVIVDGRHLADHVKVSSFDVPSSRARVAGQGVGLTITNADFFTQTDLWPAVNLTVNPTSCMNTNGSQGSNPAALTTPGMTPYQSLEAYLQAQDSVQNPANQAPLASQVVSDMTSSVEETVVKLALSYPIEAADFVFDAVEDIIKAILKGCDENPGLFTIQATDMFGNNTNQAYALSEFFNDSGTMNVNGGLLENGGSGGMADIATAYNATQIPGWASADTNYMIQNQGTYIQNTFLSPSGSFAPSLGDSGLALQVQGSGLAASQSMGGNNAYPNITLNVTNNNGCSSEFGGTWTYVDTPEQISGYWGSTAGYVESECVTEANLGNPVNPSAWGNGIAPGIVGNGPAIIGQTASLTMPFDLTPAPALTTWYACSTATCGGASGGNAAPTGATSLGVGPTVTPPSSSAGQYLAALVYPYLATMDIAVPILTATVPIFTSVNAFEGMPCGASLSPPIQLWGQPGTGISFVNYSNQTCYLTLGPSNSAGLSWSNLLGAANPSAVPPLTAVVFVLPSAGTATVYASTSPGSTAGMTTLVFTASATQPAAPGSASNPYPMSCSPGSGSNVTLNGVVGAAYTFVVTSPVCYLSVAPGIQSSEGTQGILPYFIASSAYPQENAVGLPLSQGTTVQVQINAGGNSTFTVNASPTLGGPAVSSATFVTSAG